MSDARMYSEVIELLSNTVEDFPVDDVTPGSSLKDDLGFDSLVMLEVLVAIEEHWGLKVPEQDAEKLATVQDVADCVTAAVGQTAEPA